MNKEEISKGSKEAKTVSKKGREERRKITKKKKDG